MRWNTWTVEDGGGRRGGEGKGRGESGRGTRGEERKGRGESGRGTRGGATQLVVPQSCFWTSADRGRHTHTDTGARPVTEPRPLPLLQLCHQAETSPSHPYNWREKSKSVFLSNRIEVCMFRTKQLKQELNLSHEILKFQLSLITTLFYHAACWLMTSFMYVCLSA